MNTSLIYDVGMYDGTDTAYYLHLGYNVLAIEANPLIAEICKKRFSREIAENRLTILNVGITKHEETKEIWISHEMPMLSSFNSVRASRYDSKCECLQVQCYPFSDIINEYGIPLYLKIDIEGNEHLCFDALEESKELPKYISCEIEGGYTLAERLSQMGYTHFKNISQFGFFPVEKRPNKTTLLSLLRLLDIPGKGLDRLIGKRVFGGRILPYSWQGRWFFKNGSSGPFGEYTPGNWLTFEEAKSVYHQYLERFEKGLSSPFWKNNKYRAFWLDVHARRGDS